MKLKVIYFDCFSGVSGDMILGSLLDAGLNFSNFKNELAKLNISGYEINCSKVTKRGISGTKVNIQVNDEAVKGENKSRNLNDILEILKKSKLSDNVKNKAGKIFERLALAEARVHNTSKDKIHFHEVGAIDSIIDITGATVGLELLKIDKVYSSPIHLGRGFVTCAHGKIPVPAPATLELAKNIPVYSKGIESELTTPTGIAILATLCSSFGSIPGIIPIGVGYGAGNSELSHPNLLRVIIGESNEKQEATDFNENFQKEYISIIKANVDDMNPEYYKHLMDLCFNNGALDVYLTPVQMKKERPGTEITILAPIINTDSIKDIVLKNTTTIGVRSHTVWREKLGRKNISFDTSLGKAQVKIGYKDNTLYNWTPEYDNALALTKKTGKSLKEVYSIINQEFLNQKKDLINQLLHEGQ